MTRASVVSLPGANGRRHVTRTALVCLPAEPTAARSALETLVVPNVEAHGGWRIRAGEDAITCLFDSATEALRAALAILDDACAPGSDVGLRPRIGLNTGDVEEHRHGAFGEALDVAGHIAARAPSCEAWFGLGTRVAMDAAELPWESAARELFRGSAGEQALFRLVPHHAVRVPRRLEEAARAGRLAVLRPNAPIPELPPGSLVLLLGFEAGSPEVAEALRRLPTVAPDALYLQAASIGASERLAWTDSGARLVVGAEDALAVQLDALRSPPPARARRVGRREHETPSVTVALCGVALPRVPFAGVVAGYRYELDKDGSWLSPARDALLRVDVGADGVHLRAGVDDIGINGRRLPLDAVMELDASCALRTNAGSVRYTTVDGPYHGLFIATVPGPKALRLGPGASVELGRKPDTPGLRLPSGVGRHDLRWCAGARSLQAKATGFTLDRALVGRRHARLAVDDDGLRVELLHAQCPTWLLQARGSGFGLVRLNGPVSLTPGDVLVAGTSVLGVYSAA